MRRGIIKKEGRFWGWGDTWKGTEEIDTCQGSGYKRVGVGLRSFSVAF